MILAIDPGTFQSALVLLDKNYTPMDGNILKNDDAIKYIVKNGSKIDHVVIEMVASYGMAVGTEVFETCVWIGRYIELCNQFAISNSRMYRKDVKLHICGQTRAKDANIRAALEDRFGTVGTKKNPGFFYGFKADMWQAYALGVSFVDTQYIRNVQNDAESKF